MVFKDKAGFQSMVFKDSICGMPGFGHVAHAHVNPPGLTDVVPWSSSAINIASASFFRPHVMSFAWQKDLTSFVCRCCCRCLRFSAGEDPDA
jgi:hypothetical protein